MKISTFNFKIFGISILKSKLPFFVVVVFILVFKVWVWGKAHAKHFTVFQLAHSPLLGTFPANYGTSLLFLTAIGAMGVTASGFSPPCLVFRAPQKGRNEPWGPPNPSSTLAGGLWCRCPLQLEVGLRFGDTGTKSVMY